MNELIKDIVQSYNEYINNISPGSLQIADYLRKDQVQEALQLILQFSEGMSWLSSVEELLIKNSIEVVLNVNKINEFLIEINNGLEIQDYVLVADMFEYEIAPFFENVSLIKGTEH